MNAARRAAAAWGCGDACGVERLPGGLINATFRVTCPDRPPIVLQRLHPVFAPEVNLDIDAVTAHLVAAGLETPRLVRTARGERWAARDDGVWRALTLVAGHTVHAVPSPAWAEAAGALVGRFHRAVADLDHEYASVRLGVHDTAAHLSRLERAVRGAGPGAGEPSGTDAIAEPDEIAEARDLGAEILAEAEALVPIVGLPLRHTHGDLKISNILFAPRADRAAPEAGYSIDAAPEARCLIDLDTLGRQTMAYELGDAMRSWCNPSGEDVAEPAFDHDIFAAAMRGYDDGASGLLTDAERAAVLPGVRTVCVELAARFCVDVFDDAYFGWDPTRFPSRRAHNLRRARGQLALARSLR